MTGLSKSAEERTQGLRHADLCAREKREGWDAWGDEVEKFSSARNTADSKQILMSRREQAEVRP